MAKVIEEVEAIIGTKELKITADYDQGRSPAKRFHQSMSKMFNFIHTVVPEQKSFNKALALALRVYRALPHQGTGESPAYTICGTDFINCPADLGMANIPSTPDDRMREMVLR